MIAWRLQEAVAHGDYAAACAQLTAVARQRMTSNGGGECATGVEREVAEAEVERPAIAWVRLRGVWGSVVVRERRGGLDLVQVVREGGRWRFPHLQVAGVRPRGE